VFKLQQSFILHGGAGDWDDRKEKGIEEIQRIADEVKQNIQSKSAIEILGILEREDRKRSRPYTIR